MKNPTPLTHRSQWDFTPTAPFYFDATLHKPDHFPSADNCWQPGVRWQAVRWEGLPLGLKFEDTGSPEAPQVQMSVYSRSPLEGEALRRLAEEMAFRCNFYMPLDGFYARFGAHPTLGPVIQRWRGMRPVNFGSLYEYLMIAIVLQNATVRRSVNMLQALFECYGEPVSFDGQDLYCFWEPAAMDGVSEAELRALKIGYRAKSIKRVSEALARGAPDEADLRQKGLPEQRQALLGLYGIGPASVGYLLFDIYHQWDFMEYISPWEQKIYSRLFFDTPVDQPAPVKDLLAYFSAQFPGCRMLAVHYFWEDLFWKRKYEPVEWLERLIRL